MGIKRACKRIPKVAAQDHTIDVEFVEDLASSETISSVTSVVYSPTGELSGTGAANGTKVQITLANGDAPQTVTSEDVSADTLTISSHGLSDGDMIHLTEDKDPAATSCLPGGLSTDVQYWVVGATTNTFQLSKCSGGAAVDITSASTGTYKAAKDYLVTVTAATSASQVVVGEVVVELRD